MRRLHPASAAVSGLRSGGQLALFALFAATASFGMGGGGISPLVAVAAPAAFVVGFAAAMVRWYRFEYEVQSEHLIVRSGVLSRQEREIPLRRIQNVDVRRSVLQRALGLATVRVETAGGSSTEATLDAVAVSEATRLRDELGRGGRDGRDGRRGATTGVSDAEESASTDTPTEGDTTEPGTASSTPRQETLYELTGREFATLCAVSFRPSAVIAPFVGASLFDDLIIDGGRLLVRLGIIDVDLDPNGIPVLPAMDLLYLALLGVVSFLLVVWVVSALLTFVRYYGFRLDRVGDELRYERGLLGRYSGTVPLSKVQTVTVSENAAMRRLGYASLSVDTAGATPGSNNGDGGTETAVPLDTRSRVVALADDLRAELDPESTTDEALDDAFAPETVERPPKRARRRYVVRYALGSLLVTAIAVGVDRLFVDLPTGVPLLPLVGLAVAPIAGHLTWANRGHATVDDGYVTRTGVLRRHTRLIPYFRLQTVFVSRTVFQRRRDLASVTGDSASASGLLGGDATAHDIDADDADALREELLDRLRADLARRRRARLQRRTMAEEAERDGDDQPTSADTVATTDDDTAESPVDSFEWTTGGGTSVDDEHPDTTSEGDDLDDSDDDSEDPDRTD